MGFVKTDDPYKPETVRVVPSGLKFDCFPLPVVETTG